MARFFINRPIVAMVIAIITVILGLVAMRERAELLGGSLEFAHPVEGGTLIRLTVPKENLGEKLDSHGR